MDEPIMSYEISGGIINFNDALDIFTFPENFDENKKKDLLNSLKEIVGIDTDELYDKIKDRIDRFNLAEKISCKVSTTKISNKETDESPIYYNYIIGKIGNELYLRVGMLSNDDIKQYFREKNQTQMEWTAGLKHLILCRGIKILFSGVLILENNRILITPSSGSWANNMYLLTHPTYTFNKPETSELKKITNENITDFYVNLKNSELKNKIAELNCLNIVATFYALKQKQPSRMSGISGGNPQIHEIIKSPINPEIIFDTSCFEEYYDQNDIREECKEDIPYLKSRDKELREAIINELKKNEDYKGPIIELLIKNGSKDGIKKYIRDLEDSEEKTKILKEIDNIKIWNQATHETILLDRIQEYNINKETFEELLQKEGIGNIKKAQMYFAAINKKLNEKRKRKR
jgi:hypothetical protein